MKQLFLIIAALTFHKTVFSQSGYPTCSSSPHELSQNGTFGSPFYPVSLYPNYANCAWRITSTQRVVILDFLFFDTERQYDFVYIYNGYGTSSSLLFRFDGTLTPPPTGISTSQMYMYVRFTSDSNTQRLGFEARYFSANGYPTCSSSPRELSQNGTFGSPFYPGGFYPNNANCAWRLTSTKQVVILDFLHFDTERQYDFVYIYNGYGSSSSLLFRFNGTLTPPPTGISTSQMYMYVRFTSNSYTQRSGFEAMYFSAIESSTSSALTTAEIVIITLSAVLSLILFLIFYYKCCHKKSEVGSGSNVQTVGNTSTKNQKANISIFTTDVSPSSLDLKGSSNSSRLVILATTDLDYELVSHHVTVTSRNSVKRIIRIERVENAELFNLYQFRRMRMESTWGASLDFEKRLWHGTGKNAVQNIVARGLNRSYCGRNGVACGNGVYFARDFSYSASNTYSTPDPATGEKYVFQCRVLTGYYTQGSCGMIEAPFRYDQVPYDSVVDNVGNPSMFVIFTDGQAYPEYLITFK